MGLDNGVIVRGVKRKDLPRFMRYPYEEDYHEGVEVCYWRKCWGLRTNFLNKISPSRDMESYEYKLEEKEITILIQVIRRYLTHPSEWEDSIWSYDEIKGQLYNQLWNLVLLRVWMRKHPDIEVYFYDSY